MKRTAMFIGMFWFCVGAATFLISKAQAEEVEMELKVAQGTTERTHHIADPNGTLMQCVFQAPILASKWIAENLGPNWIIVRITCGPPTKSF